MLLIMKGKIAAAYIYAQNNEILAVRNGHEIKYNGDFSRNSVLDFVILNKYDIFHKITLKDLQQLDEVKVCILIFDPKDDKQK